MVGITSEKVLVNSLVDRQITEALRTSQQEDDRVVIFPYDSRRKNGNATGYVFERVVAETIRQSFPYSVIDKNKKPYHREHWHYNQGGPALEYLRGMQPLARCERRRL